MKTIARTLCRGCQVQLKVDLEPSEVRAMGLSMPEGQPSAALLVTLDLVKLKGMMRRALTSKGKRATLDGCMLVVEPLGAVPFPEPDPDEDHDRELPLLFTGVSVAAGGHVAWARMGRSASNGRVRATRGEAEADIPALVEKLREGT